MSLTEHVLHLQVCLTVGIGVILVVAILYAAYAYIMGGGGKGGR